MSENKKTMTEIVAELEKQLAARGQSENAISQYHYIFRVFLQFFSSYHEEYYSKELMELCLREHYGIDGHPITSRRHHYKKKVLRASQMVQDIAEGHCFADRYIPSPSNLNSEDFRPCLKNVTCTKRRCMVS